MRHISVHKSSNRPTTHTQIPDWDEIGSQIRSEQEIDESHEDRDWRRSRSPAHWGISTWMNSCAVDNTLSHSSANSTLEVPPARLYRGRQSSTRWQLARQLLRWYTQQLLWLPTYNGEVSHEYCRMYHPKSHRTCSSWLLGTFLLLWLLPSGCHSSSHVTSKDWQ